MDRQPLPTDPSTASRGAASILTRRVPAGTDGGGEIGPAAAQDLVRAEPQRKLPSRKKQVVAGGPTPKPSKHPTRPYPYRMHVIESQRAPGLTRMLGFRRGSRHNGGRRCSIMAFRVSSTSRWLRICTTSCPNSTRTPTRPFSFRRVGVAPSIAFVTHRGYPVGVHAYGPPGAASYRAPRAGRHCEHDEGAENLRP